DIAEEIEISGGLDELQEASHSPYVGFRGVSIRPPMDLRNPSYTNNGDSTRWNVENTWDLDFWKGLFDRLAKMRYNLLSFATVNSLPSMIKVEGYEDIALNDVYEYTGDYDDLYLGNCTNMFQAHHLEEGNYRIVNNMTIDDKIEFWKQVMQAADDRGIYWQMSTMNTYTFSEELVEKYGITDDRDNQVTRDYFKKSYQTLLETYPLIYEIKTTCGENMDYPAEEEEQTAMWYREVYGDACKAVLDKDPERAKTFYLGFAGVGNTQLTDTFYNCWSDYPYNLYVNKRYNDTRLLSVTKCTDNDGYIETMPDGWQMMYNVRGEDAYHLTWGDPDFAREFCRNIKQDRVRGWHFAIDGYYVSGKEYEFNDDQMNDRYYYDRHWAMYSMFGRMGYEPDGISNERWAKIYAANYDVPAEAAEYGYKAMVAAGKVMPNVICQYQPGGTDAAFLPEMCTSHPTLGGFLDVKRFINSTTADPDGDIYSFSEYAKLFAAGETNLTKRTPFDVAEDLRELADETLGYTSAARAAVTEADLYFENHLLDQDMFAYLARYYADKFAGVMNLRLFNDTKDESYRTKAVEILTQGLEDWKVYAAAYVSRFKTERLPRHGVITPNDYTAVVQDDIDTAKNWKCRTYR
ncbi:MAG: hypothetical protein K6F32_07880, partial [Bacilli bacterium]|nr:hypothetical protein [Bacilli bacterium]